MPIASGLKRENPVDTGPTRTPAQQPASGTDAASVGLARPVVFLGPLPPPHNGFSAACQRMLELLRERTRVVELDVAKRGTGRRAAVAALGNRLRQFARMAGLCVRDRPHTLYLGLSGGFGQLLDVPFVALAQWFGLDIYFHHHSFAYINRPTWYSRLIMRCAPHAKHLVLCEMMRTELARIYRLPSANVQVLPNLSLIDLSSTAHQRDTVGEALTVGFLSNITAAKGIFTFFAVVRQAQDLGMPICARIAGPVAADIRAEFDAELARTPCVRYLGPVSGTDKEQFFHDIDVLLFPTTYHNEASPLIVLEAHSYGIPVVAHDRGCIGSMIDAHSGLLVPRDADFAALAIPYLQNLDLARERAGAERQALLAQFHIDRGQAEATLAQTIALISQSPTV